MKVKRSFAVLIFTLILLSGGGFVSVFGQADAAEPAVSDFTDLRIPPLGILIEKALEYSPLLKEQTAMIQMREWQEKSSRDDWARYLLFFSEVRYGSIDLIVANQNYDPTNTWRYNVGTRLQLSIFDMMDMKQKNRTIGAQREFEEFKKEDLSRMIKDDVIRLWNKLISYKEIVAINEDHVAAQSSNLFYAEQQFKAGDIPLLEYARIKEISIKAEQEYELAKKEFRETYLLLESLVGVPFNEVKN